MPFYRFRQNNSGGYFRNPARNVYVEADSEKEATELFLKVDGCYFDPNYQRDCQCCGTRWDDYIYETYPNDYELMKAIDEQNGDTSWSITNDDVPFALIKGRIKDTLIP